MPEQRIVLEEDGTSGLLAENGVDSILIEEVVQLSVAPGSYEITGVDAITLLETYPPTSAWISRGSLGSASQYDFGNYYLDIHPSTGVPEGEVVIVFAVHTSHYFFGPDGAMGGEMACVDNVGNVYTQLTGGYIALGPTEGFPCLYVSKIRHRLTTADTITLKHFGPGAVAASLWQVGLREDSRFTYLRDQLALLGSSGATDPPAITIPDLLPEYDCLLLHCLHAYGPETDAYTWDSDYERIDDAGTNTGATSLTTPPLSDLHVRGGLRIVTGITSDTVDVTSTGTDRCNAQALAALVAIAKDEDFAEFPNTPIISDFTGSDEDPLSEGGAWESASGSHPGFGSAYARRVSNQAAMSTSGTGSGSEFHATVVSTDDSRGEVEVYGTLKTVGDAILYFLAGGAGNVSNFTGGGVGYRDSGARAQNADTRGIVALFGWPNPTFNGDLGSEDGVIAYRKLTEANPKFGAQVLYPWTTHLWVDFGEGWEWLSSIRVTDAPKFNAGPGKFGIGFQGDTSTRLDDFGGGPLLRDLGQIIRRWPPRAR